MFDRFAERVVKLFGNVRLQRIRYTINTTNVAVTTPRRSTDNGSDVRAAAVDFPFVSGDHRRSVTITWLSQTIASIGSVGVPPRGWPVKQATGGIDQELQLSEQFYINVAESQCFELS